MTLCRDWTLVKYQPQSRHARPLKCRSWSCELCRPERKSQLLARAAAGNPNRFLTLTVNPRVGNDPHDRLLMLANAWRTIVKRIRRDKGPEAVEYLAIVEETKQGEPHLHILLRSVYISQAWLSKAMGELIESPIVDIRLIRGRKQVISYVAKYITKAPKQFGSAKRYWNSKEWEPPSDYHKDEDLERAFPWQVERWPLVSILQAWQSEGWIARRDKGESIIALYGRANW